MDHRSRIVFFLLVFVLSEPFIGEDLCILRHLFNIFSLEF